jgi:hypothetical protein
MTGDLILTTAVKLSMYGVNVSSEHVDRAISFVSKDEQRPILVEGHVPDDLSVRDIRGWLQLAKWPTESTSNVVK